MADAYSVPVDWWQPLGAVRPLRFGGSMMVSWAYYLEASEPCLVDTGIPGGDRGLVGRLREAGTIPGKVILTHHHPTHAANAAALKEAFDCEILAHEQEVPICEQRGIPVTATFTDGELIAGQLRVHHFPAHTPGNCSILWEPQGVVFSGDTVMGMGTSSRHPLTPPGPWEGGFDQVVRDIRGLADLDFDTLLPAHGNLVTQDGHGAVERLLEQLAFQAKAF